MDSEVRYFQTNRCVDDAIKPWIVVELQTAHFSFRKSSLHSTFQYLSALDAGIQTQYLPILEVKSKHIFLICCHVCTRPFSFQSFQGLHPTPVSFYKLHHFLPFPASLLWGFVWSFFLKRMAITWVKICLKTIFRYLTQTIISSCLYSCIPWSSVKNPTHSHLLPHFEQWNIRHFL